VPHNVVKMWPGKSDEQKIRLAETITRSVTDILSYGEDAVSVAIQEVAPEDWTEQVYHSDILGRWHDLAKRPGYSSEIPSPHR
jgi:4-oxalocrotonate tautomerase